MRYSIGEELELGKSKVKGKEMVKRKERLEKERREEAMRVCREGLEDPFTHLSAFVLCLSRGTSP